MTSTMVLGQLLLLIVAQVTLAQVESDGTCPNFQVVKDFDVSRYLGKWHGYSKYPTRGFANNNCSTVFYSDGTVEGGLPTVNVINRGYSEMTGAYSRAVGTAVAPNPAVPASLIVSFSASGRPASTTPNYNVIGTDYDNYALVYSCSQRSQNKKFELLFVLTRERQPSQEVVDQAYQGLEDQGIDLNRLKLNVQTNCPDVTADSGPQVTYMQRPVQLSGPQVSYRQMPVHMSGPRVSYRQRPVQLVGVGSPYYHPYPSQYQRMHFYY